MKVKIVIPRAVSLVGVVALGLTSAALAAFAANPPVVNFGISAPGAGALAGIYTDPYQGSVNGAPVEAFCDDFVNEVTPPQYWSAFQTNLSAFTGTQSSPVSTVYYQTTDAAAAPGNKITPLQQTEDYIAASWLAYESLLAQAAGDLTAQEQYSFALWDILDPNVLATNCPSSYGCLDPTDYSAALADAGNALAVGDSYATGTTTAAAAGTDFEKSIGYNVQIYSAVIYTNGIPSVSTATDRPQEFITLTAMPEPSAWAALAVDLFGVGVVGLVFRRRQLRNRS
jgi:hypothetical protein